MTSHVSQISHIDEDKSNEDEFNLCSGATGIRTRAKVTSNVSHAAALLEYAHEQR